MNDKLLNVSRDFTTELCFVGDFCGLVFCNGNPDFLTGFDYDTIGLDGCIGALVGIDDHILDEIGNPDVVPALSQLFQGFAGPGGKCVGAIIGPGPQIGSIPAFGYFDHHRNHFAVFCGKGR